MVDIHTFPDQPSACRAAKEALTMVLRDAGGKSVLFLVSGGSGFDILNELKEELFTAQVTVGVIDERFTTDPKVNNFLQLKNSDFYRKAMARGVTLIETIPHEGETVEDMAKRFEDDLKDWRIGHQDGVVIALMGIGRDGHTAGMMAYPEDVRTFQFLFEDSDVWVTGYDAGNRNQYPLRVTSTMPFLRKIDTAIVYAVGDAKKNAIVAICAPEGSLNKTPGRIIHEMKHCLLYTDQAVDTVGNKGA